MPMSMEDMFSAGLEMFSMVLMIQKGAPPPSPEDMPMDPDKTAYGVIVCASVPVLLLVLYMSVLGRRMRWTAIRWHVINCAVWGLLHLATTASFQQYAPFPNWIRDQEWSDKKVQVECLTRSIFPAGMVFIYIEQMLLTCSPKLAHNRVFNMFFAFFLLILVNGLAVFCFAALYMDVVWWYNPMELFNLTTYMIFSTMTIVYFIFCIFGLCCCCCTLASRKKGSRTGGTYLEMWLLFPYALLPNIMYSPSFGVTSVGFVMKVFMKFIIDSGLMAKLMGDGSGPSHMGPIDIQMIIDFMFNCLKALPWFVFLFPMVQAILAILCITAYREQFIFLISCGRCFHGKKELSKESKKDWTIGGSNSALKYNHSSNSLVQPYPVFPRTESEPIKMENGVTLD